MYRVYRWLGHYNLSDASIVVAVLGNFPKITYVRSADLDPDGKFEADCFTGS
jgi:hypothetical protein